jgi:chorismate mutase
MTKIVGERLEPPHNDLESLRRAIDALDDRLLGLIEQRLAVSAAVAALKDAAGDGLLKMRPGREAAVISRLVAQARRAPPEMIAQLWRAMMSYGLQAQHRTELILCSTGDRIRLQEMVRIRFGLAPDVRWAGSPSEALAAAGELEAVAVIEAGLPFSLQGEGNLIAFDTLRDGEGKPIAHAIGRVAPEEAGPGHVLEVAESRR